MKELTTLQKNTLEHILFEINEVNISGNDFLDYIYLNSESDIFINSIIEWVIDMNSDDEHI